jgi:hypothetical protein
MIASSIRSGSVRNPAFSLGVLLGVCFSGVGLALLLLANRVPHLDQFASDRLPLAVAFVLLGLVPACRFMKSPGGVFFPASLPGQFSRRRTSWRNLASRDVRHASALFTSSFSAAWSLASWPCGLGNESRNHASPSAAPATR